MQYQRHNFDFNFNNAIATKDSGMACDIMMHEINELVLDFPKEVKKILTDSGVKTPDKTNARDLSILMYGNLPANAKLQTGLTNLIVERHKDAHVSADIGAYDILYPNKFYNADGTENTNATPSDRITAGITAIAPKIDKSKLTDSLEQKQKQRGLTVNMSPAKIIGYTIAGIVLASAVVFTVIKLTKRNA